MAHICFAIRPEKLWITEAVFSDISKQEFLSFPTRSGWWKARLGRDLVRRVRVTPFCLLCITNTCEQIEGPVRPHRGATEFMLAYAAQGLRRSPAADQLAAPHVPCPGRRLSRLGRSVHDDRAGRQDHPSAPCDAFIAVLRRDAADARHQARAGGRQSAPS